MLAVGLIAKVRQAASAEARAAIDADMPEILAVISKKLPMMVRRVDPDGPLKEEAQWTDTDVSIRFGGDTTQLKGGLWLMRKSGLTGFASECGAGQFCTSVSKCDDGPGQSRKRRLVACPSGYRSHDRRNRLRRKDGR